MFLCQDLAFFLAWVRMKTCNGSDYPEEALPRGAFSLENIRSQGAVGLITCKFTITSQRKTRIAWENTRKVNPRNAAGFLRGAFSLEIDKECACKFTLTLNARRTFIEKTYGNWKGFRDARFSWKKIRSPGAAGRVSYEFIALNAKRILPEKHREPGGVWCSAPFYSKTHESAEVGHAWQFKCSGKMQARRILHEKTQRSLRGRREWHINLQSKWRPCAFCTRKHNDFGLVGVTY